MGWGCNKLKEAGSSCSFSLTLAKQEGFPFLQEGCKAGPRIFLSAGRKPLYVCFWAYPISELCVTATEWLLSRCCVALRVHPHFFSDPESHRSRLVIVAPLGQPCKCWLLYLPPCHFSFPVLRLYFLSSNGPIKTTLFRKLKNIPLATFCAEMGPWLRILISLGTNTCSYEKIVFPFLFIPDNANSI